MSDIENTGLATEVPETLPLKSKNTSRSKKEKAQDALNVWETRLMKVEMAVGDAVERLDILEQETEFRAGQLREIKDAMPSEEESSQRLHEQRSLKDTVEEMLAKFEAQMEEMRKEVAACKESLLRGNVGETRTVAKLDLPKPKVYKGNRDAKEIDNFLWSMEQYFEVAGIDEYTKVRTATLYLIDDAMLWWRMRHSDTEHGTTIRSWQEFKVEFKRQFYPKDESFQARKKLKALRQTGSIKDYIQEFSSLRLRLPDMPPT